MRRFAALRRFCGLRGRFLLQSTAYNAEPEPARVPGSWRRNGCAYWIWGEPSPRAHIRDPDQPLAPTPAGRQTRRHNYSGTPPHNCDNARLGAAPCRVAWRQEWCMVAGASDVAGRRDGEAGDGSSPQFLPSHLPSLPSAIPCRLLPSPGIPNSCSAVDAVTDCGQAGPGEWRVN